MLMFDGRSGFPFLLTYERVNSIISKTEESRKYV